MTQNFQLGPDKLKCICNFVIAPYFKDVLKEMLKKSDLYVICFDESLKDVTESCQMKVLIRYFDSVDRKVKMKSINQFRPVYMVHINLRGKIVIILYSKAFHKYITSLGYFTNCLFIFYFSQIYIY